MVRSGDPVCAFVHVSYLVAHYPSTSQEGKILDCLFLNTKTQLSSHSSPLSHLRFRQLCQSIIAHKLFDYVVLAFIFSNCITVALERPKILQGSLVN